MWPCLAQGHLIHIIQLRVLFYHVLFEAALLQFQLCGQLSRACNNTFTFLPFFLWECDPLPPYSRCQGSLTCFQMLPLQSLQLAPLCNKGCLPPAINGFYGRVHLSLENKALWEEFYSLGTEMIITKSGRWEQTCITRHDCCTDLFVLSMLTLPWAAFLWIPSAVPLCSCFFNLSLSGSPCLASLVLCLPLLLKLMRPMCWVPQSDAEFWV